MGGSVKPAGAGSQTGHRTHGAGYILREIIGGGAAQNLARRARLGACLEGFKDGAFAAGCCDKARLGIHPHEGHARRHAERQGGLICQGILHHIAEDGRGQAATGFPPPHGLWIIEADEDAQREVRRLGRSALPSPAGINPPSR